MGTKLAPSATVFYNKVVRFSPEVPPTTVLTFLDFSSTKRLKDLLLRRVNLTKC